MAERKYAGKMTGIRKRAKKAPKGKGLIKNRPAAKKARKQLGIGGRKKSTRKK